MQKTSYDIIIFLVIASSLLITMAAFIITFLYHYRKRQQHFEKSLEQLKLDHEKTLLSSQLEMQEQTFKHISREIHDNISLSLTLSKLNLHTIDLNDLAASALKLESSILLIGQSIAELSDISKSLNAEIIIQQGLLKAVEQEIGRIRQAELFDVTFRLIGNPVFMEAQKELIIFRIVQEAFNNIIKHAKAHKTGLSLNYSGSTLFIVINDDGTGFDKERVDYNQKAGINNMETRAKTLNGSMNVLSVPGQGTILSFAIPFH
jgi:two-component system NarL family sensor kinase